MDVAKYIGLFLLKNNFVYIHGLGNLELRKRRGNYNGEALQGGGYEVVMTPSGSIDDNLANFIATNEQISISKASNALREFSMAARADLASGKTVEIPAIGKFDQERGRVIFIANPTIDFTPPAIPSVRIARKQDDTSYRTNADLPPTPPRFDNDDEEEEQESGATVLPWSKIALIVGALLAGAIVVYFGWQYFQNRDKDASEPLITTLPTDTMQQQTTAPQVPDSTSIASPVAGQNPESLSFEVILKSGSTFETAESKAKRLQGFGLNVRTVAAPDSSIFYVVMPVEQVPATDTARILDSLRRTYNPKGVSILR